MVCRDEFFKLPDEIMLHIFSYVPTSLCRIARVCKRWQQISKDRKLWKVIKYKGTDVVNSGELEAALANGCLTLCLDRCKFTRPLFTRQLKEETYKLEWLSIVKASINMDELHEILSCCTQLRHLDLFVFAINKEICKAIARNSHLHTFSIFYGKGLTQKGLLSIVRSCRRLAKLAIVTTDTSYKNRTYYEVSTLLRELPSTLRYLNIFQCTNNVRDKHLRLLANKHPNLEELWLSDQTNLTSKAFEHVTKLRQLRTLDLINCKVPLESLKKLRCLPHLHELRVHLAVTDAEGEELQALMPGVRVAYRPVWK